MKTHKFVEYFSEKASFTGSIKDRIQPPKDAREIFMGGGIIGSDVVKMGVFGSIEELFDQREYPRNQDTAAKSVRNYYSYYSSGTAEAIGFSKTPTIHLRYADVSNIDDETKLSAFTTDACSCTLWRCGSSNWRDPTFKDKFQIVFYCRT